MMDDAKKALKHARAKQQQAMDEWQKANDQYAPLASKILSLDSMHAFLRKN